MFDTLRSDPRPQELCKDKTEKSIAVLPLLNESGDPKDEYFSDGLSEELIAALVQIRELKVIGRSFSFRFKERKEESKTIGEKLGVTTLLDGSPAPITPALLRLDPIWDSLRADPAFQKLCEEKQP